MYPLNLLGFRCTLDALAICESVESYKTFGARQPLLDAALKKKFGIDVQSSIYKTPSQRIEEFLERVEGKRQKKISAKIDILIRESTRDERPFRKKPEPGDLFGGLVPFSTSDLPQISTGQKGSINIEGKGYTSKGVLVEVEKLKVEPLRTSTSKSDKL